MEIFFYVYLFIFGLLFGSFSSVIISRLKNKKSGIIGGRSECPKCHHTLHSKDLIPLFSYISTFGKCRYCKTKIPSFYPILELCFAGMFLGTAYCFTDVSSLLSGNIQEIIKLIFYLFLGFGTLIFVIYDILYYEIPESVLALLIALMLGGVSAQHFGIIDMFPHIQGSLSLNFWENVSLFGVSAASIFGFYAIMLGGLSYTKDYLILGIIGILFAILYKNGIFLHQTILGSALLSSYIIFIFLFLQITLTDGRAMGGGDLRIAIFMGLGIGFSLTFYAILITYIVGSIIGLFVLFYAKTRAYYKKKKQVLNKVRQLLGMREQKVEINTHIPFGPFLAIGLYAILIFGDKIGTLFQTYL